MGSSYYTGVKNFATLYQVDQTNRIMVTQNYRKRARVLIMF